MSPSGKLHHAPAVRYPVVRSRWLASALVLWSLAGGLALAAWVAGGAGMQFGAIAPAGLLWLACSALAAWFWRTSPCGTLAWSGSEWTLEPPQGMAAGVVCATLQVRLDLQRCLWVRCQPDSGRALWLWLERGSAPQRWGDLRRAVYSCVGFGAADASRFAPQSDQQA